MDECTYLYSEAIHHLRSTLDNMVWALAEPTLLTPGQQRGIGFPILSDESRWHDAGIVFTRRSRSMPYRCLRRRR